MRAPIPTAAAVLLACAATAAQPPAPLSPAPAASPSPARTDEWIALHARLTLLTSHEMRGSQVEVEVRGGVVHLQGTVLSPSQKARAEQLMKSVDGVRSVVNAIPAPPLPAAGPSLPPLLPDDGNDERMREAALGALQEDPGWRTLSVSSVQDGVIQLTGTAELSDLVRALETLRALPGVRGLRSTVEQPRRPPAGDLAVPPPPAPAAPSRRPVYRPDYWVTFRAKLALLTSRGVSGLTVHVTTNDGVVALTGHVGTPWEQVRAERVVSRVPGVRSVVDRLAVVPRSGDDLREAEDEHLRREVRDRLAADGSLTSITVAGVREGVVVLKGRAGLAETLRAIAIATAVPGVKTVESQIEAPESGGYGRDSRLAAPPPSGRNA